jgi:hypothetical protein
MADKPNAQDELGIMFEIVFNHYDLWLSDMPHVHLERGSNVTSSARLDLATNVWPAVSRLCIYFEANQQAELASRIERAYHDVEDYARIIDDYCTSDKFDYNAWYYGDPEVEVLPVARGTREELLALAAKMAEMPFESEEPPELDCPEWALAVGADAAESELEKYPVLPTPDYAQRTAVRAWVCFWLVAQLERAGMKRPEASAALEEYLSSILCVSETKYRIIPEVLSRVYGQHIYPLPILESPEVSHILQMFGSVLAEIREATAPKPSVAPEKQSWELPWRKVTDKFLPLLEATKTVNDQPAPMSIKIEAHTVELTTSNVNVKKAPNTKTVPADDEANVFRKKGDKWEVRYRGKDPKWLDDMLGAAYIAYLLARPGESLTAVAIEVAVKGLPAGRRMKEEKEDYAVNLEEDRNNTEKSHGDDVDQLADSDAVRAVCDERASLAAELKDAEAGDDASLVAELKRKIGLADKWLQSTRGYKEKNRKWADEAEKARKRVSKCIEDVRVWLDKEYPELALHLRSHLDLGGELTYLPEGSVHWQV